MPTPQEPTRTVPLTEAERIRYEEQQRREIAEDLHDHLGQGLAMLQLKLRELRGNAIFCGLDHTIAEMERLLEQAIRYTRTLTHELSPPVLHELGLAAALEWLAETTAKRTGLAIHVEPGGIPPALASPLAVMLFKSVRELLVNVGKHARATRVEIVAEAGPEALEIRVEDDGVGFGDLSRVWPVATASSQGFGLFSIHERLVHLGGELVIDPPGARPGARVRLRLPRSVIDEVSR